MQLRAQNRQGCAPHRVEIKKALLSHSGLTSVAPGPIQHGEELPR
jgi:hypothetical protein